MKSVSLPRDAVYTGDLILVNGNHPFHEGRCDRRLVAFGAKREKIPLHRRTAAALRNLMGEMACGDQIIAVSGYRSRQEQERIYAASLRENGVDFTTKYVALPGHSEHQTGLAVDLALHQPEIDFLCPHFPYTGICGAFREKAPQYGLIERYPKGREAMTGIAHEPWHFRFVGVPHAMIMSRAGDTLEEYHARLKRFPYGGKPLIHRIGRLSVEICYLPADRETVTLELETDRSCTVSGNNRDGFIVSVWRESQ